MVKGKLKRKPVVEEPRSYNASQAAEELGVSAEWVRARIAAGAITPRRASTKRNAPYAFSDADIAALRLLAAEDPTAGGTAALARVSQLEGERANLLAQVAWERAIAQEQQKSLEHELARTERLTAEVDLQRTRVEALKALSTWDRMLGRQKAI